MTVTSVDIGRGGRRLALQPGMALWAAIGVVVIAAFALKPALPWLHDLPKDLIVPLNAWFNVFMEWFVATFKDLFRAVSWALEWPMRWLQAVLAWLPWPATMVGFVALGFAAGGVRLAGFTLFALLYMLVTGYWDPGMNTLAMVGVSVPLSAGIGLALGIAAFKSRRAERIIQPTLDLMQTVPTFAYLIPILLLFGFGPVVGLIASAIYAAPPMVRNVILGLQRVPSDIVESGRMAGCTRRQLLWWVQVPAALPTIMVGLNQTILAALSMVIIASVIGSFADVGWALLNTMRKAEFGQSLLAGLVIVLIAMVVDRTSRGFAQRQGPARPGGGFLARHRGAITTLAGMAVAVLIAQAIAPLHDYPKGWVLGVAEPLNDLVSFINTTFPDTIEWVKERILFYFLLPLRSGFAVVVKPQTWGFTMSDTITVIYVAVAAVAVLLAVRAWSWRAGVAIAAFGGIYYFGTVNVPWLAFMAVVLALAWQIAGWRVAAFAAFAMGFMLLTGVWTQVMMSVYLCGAAVLIASLIGCSIGIWAARNERVSRIVNPVVDTLQTMPTFVYLIPVIMFFQVGDLPALLAIISYAITPAIRYTEHGIRGVRADVVEAARCMGTSERQLLWQVQLPLALPEIMLGINQTIMFGLAMLVVSALVGTKELGQLVYRALTSADPGKGAIAGLSMAFIAIIADRVVQAWSAKKKASLGL